MARSTTRFKRVATVVPLALVSAAWTTHVAGAGPIVPGTTAAPVVPDAITLPDGTRMPRTAVDYPASLSGPGDLSASDGQFRTVAATPSSSDIPAQALAAYQRAETVIYAADPACGVSWQLLAAIGKVESDHGRYAGASLDADGVATPSIIGPVLDGRNGTAIIRDTDAGEYDGDTSYDRAVGPMQFIPSTWAAVGVDADDDGVRNPHDIDDAALAAAVYLCSGDEDLSTTPGQRDAVHRYNRSNTYVDLVLSIMQSYLDGDFTSGPPSILSARTGYVDDGVATAPPVVGDDDLESAAAPVDKAGPGASSAGSSLTAPEASGDPLPGDGPTKPGDGPTKPDDDTEQPGGETEEPTEGPSEVPTEEPVEQEPVEEEPAEPVIAEPGSLSPDEAIEYCADEPDPVDDPALPGDAAEECVDEFSIAAEEPEQPANPDATEAAPLRDEATAPRD
jgi:hypothetical protein